MTEHRFSRRTFIRCSSLAAVGSIAETLSGRSYSARQDGATKETIQALIQKAGNADSDEVRLTYLKQLQNRQKVEPSLKKELANSSLKSTAGFTKKNWTISAGK
ncbi:MAG: hypothetical protein JXM79_19795 [Sedimentisphaerales bacterium]|nr:hypothetical protein [Sedimentisphaerales bacterium]